MSDDRQTSLASAAQVDHAPTLPSMQDLHWQRQLLLAAENGPVPVVEAWLQAGVIPNDQTVSAALRREDPIPAVDALLAAAPHLVPGTLNRSRVMGDDGVLDLVLQHTSPSVLNERAGSPFPLWLEAFARAQDVRPGTDLYDEAMAARIPTVLAKLTHAGADVESMRTSPYVRDAQSIHGQVLRQALGIEPSLSLEGVVTGVQVVPVINDGTLVEAQFEGPDHRTTDWGVYVRDRERHANHVQDFKERAVAERFAKELASAHAVKVEPYPWEERPTLSMVAPKPKLDQDDGEHRVVMRQVMRMSM
ncbi:hypothetical protein [Paraburkholderia sp. C35]|uniref:hypothetical protein n=1 Tax=Paraburkholderia sp. C35 TaxID=2126993 RepID=UPI000D6915FC|nr:hypothetical protein [Paraburkholderia sp. C35]